MRYADAAKPDIPELVRTEAAKLAGITGAAPESVRDTGFPGNLGPSEVAFLAKLGDLSGPRYVLDSFVFVVALAPLRH